MSDLKEKITALVPEAGFDETGEFLTVTVPATMFRDLAISLRNQPDLLFDYLFCHTCIDWKTQLTVVYHFTSTEYRHNLVIKCNLDRTNPEIETVSDIWRTNEFHEREVFELFGVNYLHHPDLRKLILTDDFEGFPLRKDFEDPINMIKL